jgi:acyl-CoA synthetase (AMP-forming)/AMP-acid ligase II
MSKPALDRIHLLFEHRHQLDPNKEFLFTPTRNYTFSEINSLVNQLEKELLDQKIVPGDRILIIAENCPEHIALILACSRVGAWSCGVNARMSKGEISTYLKMADPKLIYFTTGVSAAAKEHAALYQPRASALDALSLSLSDTPGLPAESNLVDQIAAIIFTSGTTGSSKGVLVSHLGLTHFGRVSAESRDLGPNDKSYAYLPMTHIFGLGTVLMASLYAGASLILRTQFDPADAYEALANGGLTTLQGPSAMYTRLLDYWENLSKGKQKPSYPNLRYVYMGASALDYSIKLRVEQFFGFPLNHGYGLSEYAGAVSVTKNHIWRKDTSSGYLVEGGEVIIVDPDGKTLPKGERGELWIRGIGLMPGYFRDPEETKKVMRPNGWLATGDIAYFDEDDALFVVGRLKEMIIRSGFNVYPAEVETILNSYPGILQSAVVGKKEIDGNETIIAFVQLNSEHSLDQDALKKFLKDNLAPYKLPARIIEKDKFPLTFSGKIIKRELLESVSQ